MKKPRCISVGVKFRCKLREASEQLSLTIIFVKFWFRQQKVWSSGRGTNYGPRV
jgi:hypothetical protein